MKAIVICKTCAAMNAYESFSMPFVQSAYEFIGNTITVTAFSFALALGILLFAFNSLFPDGFDPFDAIKKIVLVVFISSVLTQGTAAGMAYVALLQWGTDVAHGLLSLGSDGDVIIPDNAKTDAAKLIGSAEAYLWDFITFSWNVIQMPNLFDSAMGSVGDYIVSIMFGIIIFCVYGVIILYFSYMVLRSLIYLQISLAFSTLIIASAAFSQTRNVFKTGLSLMVNAALTLVGAGFAMGVTSKILSGTKILVACYSQETLTEQCKGQVFQLSRMLGVDYIAMQDALKGYEIFALFTILGFFCLFIHYLVVKYINMLTSTPDDSNALLGFSAATKGALLLGAGTAISGAQKGLKGIAQGGKLSTRSVFGGGKTLYEKAQKPTKSDDV